MEDANNLLHRLSTVGAAVFGPEWQRPMARELGRYHPRGTDAGIDYRLVKRWVSGERPVPGWVEAALPRLLQDVRSRLLQCVEHLDQVASSIN